MQQQALIDMAQKKQELIYELSSYQNATAGSGSSSSIASSTAALSSGISTMIPPDTRVDSCIALNKSSLTCELILRTNNETVIKAAIIFGEQVRLLGIFTQETMQQRPHALLLLAAMVKAHQISSAVWLVFTVCGDSNGQYAVMLLIWHMKYTSCITSIASLRFVHWNHRTL